MILNYENVKKDINKNLGIDYFQNSKNKYIFQGKNKSKKYIIPPNFQKMIYKYKEISGEVEFMEPNFFILKKGSEYLNTQTESTSTKNSLGKFLIDLRNDVWENAWSFKYEKYSKLKENIVFFTPSGLSCFITGNAQKYIKVNWIGQDGKILDNNFEEDKNLNKTIKKSEYNKLKKIQIKEHVFTSIEKKVENTKDEDVSSVNHYGNISIKEQKELSNIQNNSNIDNKTKKYLYEARVGQGKYRKDLLALYNNTCVISNIKAPELLIASHILPWVDSDNDERLDENNGLLLSASIDKLFDKHYISFDDNGFMVVSNKFKQIHPDYKDIMSTIGIYESFIEQKKHLKLSDETKKYMKRHFKELKK